MAILPMTFVSHLPSSLTSDFCKSFTQQSYPWLLLVIYLSVLPMTFCSPFVRESHIYCMPSCSFYYIVVVVGHLCLEGILSLRSDQASKLGMSEIAFWCHRWSLKNCWRQYYFFRKRQWTYWVTTQGDGGVVVFWVLLMVVVVLAGDVWFCMCVCWIGVRNVSLLLMLFGSLSAENIEEFVFAYNIYLYIS